MLADRASVVEDMRCLWPVCLHSAVLMQHWEQQTTSPPDECSLCYYTPPSDSRHRSPSVSEPDVAWRRTTSHREGFPRRVSSHPRGPQENPLSLIPEGPQRHFLLCCTRHRGWGLSPVAVSPVVKRMKMAETFGLELDKWEHERQCLLLFLLTFRKWMRNRRTQSLKRSLKFILNYFINNLTKPHILAELFTWNDHCKWANVIMDV